MDEQPLILDKNTRKNYRLKFPLNARVYLVFYISLFKPADLKISL